LSRTVVKESEKMFGLGKRRSKFGKWIDRRGLKQEWIAEKSGVSRSTISQLANDDEREPTLKNARKIIKALREIDPNVKQDDFWSM
jgi:DNA-binding XRE family transcriptional regulator